MSSRGLLAAWNSCNCGFCWWSRKTGMATRVTSSDAAPALESALGCPPSCLPHTHLSPSSATATWANATANTNNAAESDLQFIPETIRFVVVKIAPYRPLLEVWALPERPGDCAENDNSIEVRVIFKKKIIKKI